jgi:hypothetical protein
MPAGRAGGEDAESVSGGIRLPPLTHLDRSPWTGYSGRHPVQPAYTHEATGPYAMGTGPITSLGGEGADHEGPSLHPAGVIQLSDAGRIPGVQRCSV